jgi:hypothetical protein
MPPPLPHCSSRPPLRIDGYENQMELFASVPHLSHLKLTFLPVVSNPESRTNPSRWSSGVLRPWLPASYAMISFLAISLRVGMSLITSPLLDSSLVGRKRPPKNRWRHSPLTYCLWFPSLPSEGEE